ncbi:MAG TPA: hypothetical protein VFX89_00030 [Gammaproteobacteria bacterium]|nr:hypothetical protein [Gammaproteobacteria bacterium]
MSSTVRPDNLRAALDAKLAAAMSQLVELREAEQPRVTPHLSAREIIGAFLGYARSIYSVAAAFGSQQVGDLQFNSWYAQWTGKLSDPDRALWKQLRDDRSPQHHGLSSLLTELEIAVAADPSVTVDQTQPGTRPGLRKRIVRFATAPERAASDVCEDYLRLAKRFAGEFIRDHTQWLR